MDRTEIAMGLAALDAQTMPSPAEPTGTLSDAEQAELPHTEAWFEHHVSTLYVQLDTARRSRIRERSRYAEPGEREDAERARYKALDRARELYELLTGEGWKPDEIIADLMLTEGALSDPKPFEHRAPVERICRVCGNRYTTVNCPLCANSPP